MQITTLQLREGRVEASADDPVAQPLEEFQGETITGFALVDRPLAGATVQLAEIEVGGGLIMHSGPLLTICQVVSGRGTLGLPDGGDWPFDGPELFVFEPDTLHSWHSIEAATTLSIVIVGT
jgi:quercetin dioxygenase-like cupin family protein